MKNPEDSAETTEAPVLRPIDIVHRLQRERRWKELEPLKNQMIKEARKQGMRRDDAQLFAYDELHRLYPPLPIPEPEPEDDIGCGEPGEPEETDEDSAGDVTEPESSVEGSAAAASSPRARAGGVGQIPESWPQLPGNASLAAEIAWCQAERLRVVDESNAPCVAKVDLSLASVPAPSMAALSWLETSIRSYAKYVDVVARVMATQVDEQQHVHRERMAIDEIKALLREMRKS